MSLNVIALSDLLSMLPLEEVQSILDQFKSITITGSESAHDVETFLKEKAINFDKSNLAKTHLVFASYKSEQILVGYYAIISKPFIFTKRQYSHFSKSLLKRLRQKSVKNIEVDNLIINGYLIGQLGKNYNQDALATKSLDGNILLNLAYETIMDAQRLTGGSYIWLEYEDNGKLRNFYKSFGFTEIENFTTTNNLKMAILKI